MPKARCGHNHPRIEYNREENPRGCPLCDVRDALREYREWDEPKQGRRIGEKFWFINPYGNLQTHIDHESFGLAEKLWNFGNYFYTKEQANKVLNNFDPETNKGYLAHEGLSTFYKLWQRHFGIRGRDD